MKRNLISIVIFLTALSVAWLAYGQTENRQSRQNREGQQGLQNLSADERAKLRGERQSISEEERQKIRAQMREQIAVRSPIFGRQEQLKVIEDIEQQLVKLKDIIKKAPDREEFRKLPEASSEQQAKFREEWQEARQQQQKMVNYIQEQLAKLAEPRPPERILRPDIPINELKVIHEMAAKENAPKTAEIIEKLITRLQKGPKDQPVRPVRSEGLQQQVESQKKVEGTTPGKNTGGDVK
ncbi:MAG: hypothetical protein A2167_07155 [Planctomycetes bacterium RBG_13_46_10]|nr:MAG: hypothetical protein A2167_07155 [Planctomycetes bacterium RBG_13_46_10]